jgi:tRNA pseudouridine38-40 synthase
MTRFALTIEFDGQPYFGWQRQEHGATVQQSIEEAISAVTGESAVLFAAGRTDAGVHALAMRAHVDIVKPFDAFRLSEAINALLRPQPIAITECAVVDDDWHARFTCIAREYRYIIANRRVPLALEQNRAWRVPKLLDNDSMHDAAQALVGLHDFTTFRSAHCQSASPVKSVELLSVHRKADHVIVQVRARSFLHHQVRSIVGCLVEVGLGKWSKADLQAALDARDRAALAFNAPPDGLYFVRAYYPDE